MIVVDTNVLSELMRPKPNPLIVVWAGKHFRKDAYTTAITKAELLSGILRMPSGRQKERLAAYVNEMLSDIFLDRILAFNSECAERYANIVATRFRKGLPIEPPDAQIAAITSLAGAAIATRNVADFEACGLTILNPWTS